MALPRPPDWVFYGGAVAALMAVSASGKRVDAPAAPPPVAESPAAMTAGSTLKPSMLKQVPAEAFESASGTAFSISDQGVWLTARHVVSGCPQAAVMVAEGRGVQAKVFSDRSVDVAVLTTQGGSAPLPIAPDSALTRGARGFHPGFPRGTPGEAASRLLGRYVLAGRSRGEPRQTVSAWAEVGRTDGLKGSLAGLSGAPVLDRAGRVVGVTLAESPRRGRIYSAPPAAIMAALKLAGHEPAGFARGQPVTTENYGRVADSLRRDLRVAQVVCLS